MRSNCSVTARLKAIDHLRVHIRDNPHGSAESSVRRLLLRAAGAFQDPRKSADFIQAFWREFETLALASADNPRGAFTNYARRSCLDILDVLEGEYAATNASSAPRPIRQKQ